jgi:deoxyribose-phosphate aldolase
LKSGDYQSISSDIKSVLNAAGSRALIKVVVDLGQLTREEQIKAALIAKMTGASYLKVAAGSKPDGVTADDIKLIRSAVGPDMGIKADGGIRNHQRAVEVIEAGATRIGASGSVKIVTYA